MRGQWDNMMGNGWAWVGMLIGGLLFLGLLILIIFLIVRLVLSGNRQGPGNVHQYGGRESAPRSGSRAMEILDERYAHGEISDQEYIKMKNELKK